MEIISPLTAWAWNDPCAWAHQVLEICEQNGIKLAGIREFRAALATGKLSNENIEWLQTSVNDELDRMHKAQPHDMWLCPRRGLVMSEDRGEGYGPVI